MPLHSAEEIIAAMKALPPDERMRLCSMLRHHIPGVTDEYVMVRIAVIEYEESRLQRMVNLAMELGSTRQRKPGKRNVERDAEILRLAAAGKTPGRIRQLIKNRWPMAQNGMPLTAGAVKAVIMRARGTQRQAS
jgi:hypothetical protein